MALHFDFAKIENWPDVGFIGLTPEQVKETGIDFAKSFADEGSGWMDPADPRYECGKHWQEKGWVAVHRKPYVEQLLWALMAVMPQPGWGIVERNLKDVIHRTLIWQELVGPLDQEFCLTPQEKGIHWKPRYVTDEDIKALLGLYVNISAVSLTEFRKKIESALSDRAKSRLWVTAKEAKEAEPAIKA